MCHEDVWWGGHIVSCILNLGSKMMLVFSYMLWQLYIH
jgi:hypothetical protein